MSTIKIGEKEYTLPFQYQECRLWVVDGNDQFVCEVGDRFMSEDFPDFHALGQHIADALNDFARVKELEAENAKLEEVLSDFMNAFKDKYPVAFVGDPTSKEEKLYLAYHEAKAALEGK